MRLLVVTKMHPPGSSTRSIQVGRMLKALRAQGAEITVITEATDSVTEPDPSVIRLPSRRVHYTSPLLHRVSRTVEHHVDMTNPYHRWTRGAVKAACAHIDRERPDVVLTLSWPFNPHMVGLAVKRRYPRLPWAAFFSDPFPATIIGGYWDRYPVPFFSRHQEYCTKKVLHRADSLIMPNALAPSVFCTLAPQRILDSFVTMPHIGAAPQSPQPVEPGWLTHIGTLDPPRCCEPLLIAVKALAETDPSFKGLRLVGVVADQFIEQAERLGIAHLLDRVGSVPSDEAQRIAQRSQALLILEADLPKSYFLPSKLADYVYVNRPIFAITPPLSTIRNYFRPFPVGEAVAWHSPTLTDQLRSFWQRSMRFTESDYQGLQALYDPHRNAQHLLQTLGELPARYSR